MNLNTNVLLQQLSSTRGVAVHAPADDSHVRELQLLLRKKLPTSYVSFLKSCGWVTIAGKPVYGLGPGTPMSKSSFQTTLNERTMRELRSNLIAISRQTKDKIECLDVAHTRDGDCPVVLWDHAHPRSILQVPKQLAPTFTAWLHTLLVKCPEYTPVRAQPAPVSRTAAASRKRAKSMRTIDDALDRAKGNSLIHLHRPATTREISSAESKLGVSIPGAYAACLRRAGRVILGTEEYFGLGPDAPFHAHLVKRNVEARNSGVPPLPTTLLAIADDGMGGFECLDLTRIQNGDCPIVNWDIDHPRYDKQKPRVIARSFTKWFIASVRDFEE